MPETPFIAVGGGLAGAAFALELARHGAPALVLETRGGKRARDGIQVGLADGRILVLVLKTSGTH